MSTTQTRQVDKTQDLEIAGTIVGVTAGGPATLTGMFFTCRDLARNIDRLDDPTVPAWQRWLGRAHVASCRHCARFVRQYRATVLALSKLADASPSRDEPGLTAFRQWRHRA